MAEDYPGSGLVEPQIPNFEVGDSGGFSFPEGAYYAAMGKLIPQYADEDDLHQNPIAVNHEIWILKRLDGDKSEQRIDLRDGNVSMKTKGTKLVERYPNPSLKPNMKWRAAAFFTKFDCISEVPNGANPPLKVVDWAKVKQKYGIVFKMILAYSESKNQPGKKYRNIQYDSIEMIGSSITSEDMHKIERTYDMLKESEKVPDQSAPAQISESDLPF